MLGLSPAERLIVALNFRPPESLNVDTKDKDWVLVQIWNLCDKLKSVGGITLKVNSALGLCGYELIHFLHNDGFRVFADLKLNDIGETLSTYGRLLQSFHPEFLTVMCASSIQSMKALKAELPTTEILGVTVLTDLDNNECLEIYESDTYAIVRKLARRAKKVELGGIICSPKEVSFVRGEIGEQITVNTPGIRPAWAIVEGDDQKRFTTPREAIMAGADRIVVGRPIAKAKNPYDATMRTIDEIARAIESREKGEWK